MREILLAGTYTSQNAPGILEKQAVGRGIYLFEYDSRTGRVEAGSWYHCQELNNPSYLVDDLSNNRFFAVSEGTEEGIFFEYGMGTGIPMIWGRICFEGAGACHIAYDPLRCLAAVSCYESGSIALFDVGRPGNGKLLCTAQFRGSGADPVRQEAAHAHSSLFQGTKLLTADLGSDCIHIYETAGSKLEFLRKIRCRPGSGPRHMCVAAPNEGGVNPGGWLYVVNELDSTLSVFDTGHWGEYKECQVCSLAEKEMAGYAMAADLCCSLDGYLYVSTRGENTIRVFRISAETGILTEIQKIGSGGRGPRSICLDKTQEHIIVANQQDGVLTVFKRKGGRLLRPASVIKVPAPAKVMVMEIEIETQRKTKAGVHHRIE